MLLLLNNLSTYLLIIIILRIFYYDFNGKQAFNFKYKQRGVKNSRLLEQLHKFPHFRIISKLMAHIICYEYYTRVYLFVSFRQIQI